MKSLNLVVLFLVATFIVLPLNAQNYCLDFDGVNDHVLVPSNSELRPANNFTIEAWIKPNDIITQKVIMMHDENGGGNDGYSLTFTNSVINFGAHNGSPQYIISDEMLVVNSWNHIAGVYDNSTLKLYVNGVSKTLVGSGSVVYSLTDFVNIGRRGGTNLPNTLFYDGEMDELRFWNVARTEAEINDNMFHSLTGSETGLTAYWQFNEGTGTNLGDSSGSNDGTLTNMEEADWVESPLFRPVVQSFLPIDDDIDVMLDPNLEITFDRNVTAGAGNVVIYQTANDSIVETISASSCVIVDSMVTIDPSNDFEFKTDYYVLIEASAFHDGSDNYFDGISDKTVWNFESQNLFLDINAGLQGVDDSSVAWGDYDNDGDLDILLTGSTGSGNISKIYQNNDGAFTDINAGLSDVYMGSVAWGDYDNDGDLDILLTGYTGSDMISRIYQNNDGAFTDINAGLSGIVVGSVAWGDYDNDGDLDILLTGTPDGSIAISKIYRNDSGVFTEINVGLIGVWLSSVAWGDYDNDGDLDILLTGTPDGSIAISKIYRNDSGVFTEINVGLIGVAFSSVAWGDYDNNGDLDILLTGDTVSGKISKIYRNDSGVFTEINVGLIGVSNSSVAWGDYDNDGDLDILLAGRDESSIYISKIYRNDPGVFTDINAGLQGVSGSVAWGDYDNDGDLDILLAGRDSLDHEISLIYNNCGSVFNTVPNPPSNLSTEVNGSEITFSWDKATDIETPQDGLSYNIYVGTTVDKKDSIKSSMSDISTGYRKIVSLGNLNNNTSWTIKDIEEDSYYCWSVQAVDHAFAGSVFATEQIHLPIYSPTNVVTTVNGTNIELTWDAVDGVSFYKVYASDDPYGIFVLIGVEMGEIWITPYTESKKFYYVIAVSGGKEEDEKTPIHRVSK
ncbi:MAG: hypothetical protein GQ534_08400 [Candidatus Delongbacteria bacterium]|nr:hypothetical protein [Candidatus Delongbacteria bacterium]